MNAKSLIFSVREKIAGPRICWMTGSDRLKASIVVCMTASVFGNGTEEHVTKLADKVEKRAAKEANRIGNVVSVGVTVGGQATGGNVVSVTGIADVWLTPETEKKLEKSGIFQLR